MSAPGEANERIQLAHGGGGRMMQDLLEGTILPAFANSELARRHDGAVFSLADAAELAFTTDGHVVQPLFFPGGDIGSLAINGAVNDLAMCGAEPWQIAVALILEEGLPLADLRRALASMATAAAAVGAQIVTGDTKVVERGKGDGLFVTTSAIGRVRAHTPIGPQSIRPGDAILVSGDLGRHAIAVMSARLGLSFDPPLESDCAPLWPAVSALFEAGLSPHCLRDLTRGGLAAALVEIAETASQTLEIEEATIPVAPEVHGACELLGFDPIHLANEGRFVTFVRDAEADKALAILRYYGEAHHIGHVSESPKPEVLLSGLYGVTRRLILPRGELLPRIC